MLEESVPAAIWASMSSWFTPTVFFVVLNLVIGTIAVTSKVQSNTRPTKSEDGDGYNNHDQQPRLLTRGSSLLTRFKSINLHRYVSFVIPPTTETLELQPEPNITITTATASSKTTTVPTPSPTVESEFETMEEAYSAAMGFDFRKIRSESEMHPALETERKAVMGGGLVRKSGSAKKKTEREEQGTDFVERPPTVREESGEVDARADDFISRFRKQLQLQRLNSIDAPAVVDRLVSHVHARISDASARKKMIRVSVNNHRKREVPNSIRGSKRNKKMGRKMITSSSGQPRLFIPRIWSVLHFR